MSNTLLSISMITNESLRILKNQLGFAKGVNRQYDDSFAQKGAKIGSVINIRKPVKFAVTSGAALNIQDVTDVSSALTLDTQNHVGFQFSSKDLTLSIDEFSSRYLKPAIASLANKIDFDGMTQYKNVWNAIGTYGTAPSALSTILAAGRKLDENLAPMDDQRSLVLNPNAQASMVDALKALFQSSEQIKDQYEKGRMGVAAGFTWKMDQNVNTHTVGPQGGSPTVATTVSTQGATTIATQAWTASAASRLKKGDVFTVASVNAVNAQNKQTYGVAQQFVVTADFSSDGSGNGTVSVSPAMYTTGALQNIDRFPTASDVITVLGTASTTGAANLAYHKDAFVLGMADLELPSGVDMAARAADDDAGLSIRIVRAYDINNDMFPCRLDVLYGWQTVYPELACRIHG